MKARRVIYFVIGGFLIMLNIIIDINGLYTNTFQPGNIAYNTGAIIGGHLFLIVGFFFLRAAYKLNKKIKAANNNELEKEVESIGQDSK